MFAMATMSELIAAGVSKMRLPIWNPLAYAVPNDEGPWAMIYDVDTGVGVGVPIPVLIGMCDEDDRWEPSP